MVAGTGVRMLNGNDVDELATYVAAVDKDRSRADRNPTVTARWLGGSRSATSSVGGPEVFMGGDDEPSAMNMLLRTLVACDIEVVSTTATLIGVEIEELSIEASGFFHIARLLGLESPDNPCYQRIGYTVRLRARNATPDQLEAIRQACLRSSPVGDTLQRPVPLTLDFDAA